MGAGRCRAAGPFPGEPGMERKRIMAKDTGDGSVWVATESFVTDLNGERVVVQGGHTRVRDGHPLLKGHEQSFRRMEVHFEVEQTTAAPGEKRKR